MQNPFPIQKSQTNPLKANLSANQTQPNINPYNKQLLSLVTCKQLITFKIGSGYSRVVLTFLPSSPLFVLAPNKMQGHFWHLFLVFYALSHGTLGFALHGSSFNHFLIGATSSAANKILWHEQVVIKAAMENKTKGTMWKSLKNYIRNWCQKWPYIMFRAIYRENKQCLAI